MPNLATTRRRSLVQHGVSTRRRDHCVDARRIDKNVHAVVVARVPDLRSTLLNGFYDIGGAGQRIIMSGGVDMAIDVIMTARRKVW